MSAGPGLPALLIVDDDASIRRLVTVTLDGVAGFRLVEAADGPAALEVFAAERPAVVLLDIEMPGGPDGVEVARRIRDLDGGAEPRIVMLTGASEESTRERALAAGADLFLTKPFSPLELLRLVDAIGERGR
jgi:DNA-binding response OmpR family regulator